MATEKEWQATVVDTATLMGWASYHTHDSMRTTPGFPDLVLARQNAQGGRVVFAELKTDRPSSQLSEHQKRWVKLLANCGQEVYVWRPSDWETVRGLLA